MEQYQTDVVDKLWTGNNMLHVVANPVFILRPLSTTCERLQHVIIEKLEDGDGDFQWNQSP